MKAKFILGLLLVGIVTQLSAYPISPRPLRKLIIESEYIAYAKVLRIKKIRRSEEHWYSHKAILEIKEVLQGKIKTEKISVYFVPGLVCPAPARYVKKKNFLVFLTYSEIVDGFITHAFSYGSKQLNAEDYAIYKSRILEMQMIQRIKAEDRRISKTADWLVACAQSSVTRIEGVYELSPTSHFMSYFDRDKDIFIRKYRLTREQVLSLRQTLLAIEYLEYTDLALVDLVVTEQDEEVINLLKRAFLAEAGQFSWFRKDLMKKIAQLVKRQELMRLVDEVEGLNAWKEEDEKLTIQLMEAFGEKL